MATPLGTVEELLAFYSERGYGHRIGPGTRPAIVVIDFSLAFTGGYAEFPGRNFAPELAATRRLLDAARAPGGNAAPLPRIPVFYTTLSYASHLRDAGFWAVKVPWLGQCLEGTELVRIDPALDRQPAERVIVKKYPSAFFGTGFDDMLRAERIDTLVIAGCTTSVCVRATALDAMQYGYRAIVAAEAVGDFNRALHALHLMDIGSRYADVMATGDVVDYLLSPADKPAVR